jgi:hypothetical protein
MSTDSTGPADRCPPSGPEECPLDQYQFTMLAGENGLVSHVEEDAQWIESDLVLVLSDWR